MPDIKYEIVKKIAVLSKLALEKIRELPFADQIKVFYSGFGLWHAKCMRNVSAI